MLCCHFTMTSENTKQPDEGTLEAMLACLAVQVDHVDTVLQHVYNTVNDIVGKTDDIYDAIAYHRDSPAYNPDMGFIDGLDE